MESKNDKLSARAKVFQWLMMDMNNDNKSVKEFDDGYFVMELEKEAKSLKLEEMRKLKFDPNLKLRLKWRANAIKKLEQKKQLRMKLALEKEGFKHKRNVFDDFELVRKRNLFVDFQLLIKHSD